MPLNPVERKEFILACMPALATGVLSNQDMLDAMATAHSRGGADRIDQTATLIYDMAVVLADKYDAENP